MRSLLFSLLAASCTLPCLAAADASALPGSTLALLWLAALGWRGLRLSRRLLHGGARLAAAQQALAGERAARQQADAALDDARQALATLAARQGSVAARARQCERRRIARDVHDDLGQNLLALKLDLEQLQARAGTPQAPQLARVLANLDITIRSLRTIINNLRPAALDAGLQAAIERQLREFSRASGIACRLDADAAAFAACAPLALGALLYRVLQEALSNVARHAQATEVCIVLERRDGRLRFEVHDNGIGIGVQRASGCGLLGIGERVAARGGRFAITSSAGAGTLLSLDIPLTAAVGEIGKLPQRV